MEFAKRGATVILACRSEERAKKACEEIIRLTNNKNVSYKIVDLSSLNSVRKFANEINTELNEMHILVNNAGAGGLANKITADGLQILMAINYFGPTLLTMLLLDLLKKSGPARIVNVSSVMARYAKLDPNDLNKFVSITTNYSNSKLCNIIFTKELASQLSGTKVSAFSVHPGAVRTEIFRHLYGFYKYVYDFLSSIYFKTPEEGAQTVIYTATEPGIEQLSGEYFEECFVRKPISKNCTDAELRKAVWSATKDILNLQ